MTAIHVHELRKRYGPRVAVDGVGLTVRPGEVFGILGRNGAGKTTTVEAIAGLRRPDAGTVRVLGLDPWRDRLRLRQVLGVQLQDTQLHHALTVHELVRLYRTFYASGAVVSDLIEAVGLSTHRDVRFERLSGGQQQRLSIALALVGRPRVVILDELTSGLDPEARRHIWAIVEDLRDDGVTVLLVSHLMEEVERLCDRVALLERGRLVATDTPSGLVERAGLGQRVRFRVASGAPFDAGLVRDLPQVEQVEVRGDEVSVHGGGDLLGEVSTALVRAGVVATETRLERATLDDAFLALTGSALENTDADGDPDAGGDAGPRVARHNQEVSR
ncbi:ABC transporter related [Beutenbergia cavernae DSM 12333]|uniref:ABC transporter related n=1 Tax=Beutenbergia cavernae (strain ATCC BAA-8 / DSM 12333 / CCUG 43141 / JCM 11478 / NBRC 16432 / NCIMB 13614 / HKI 0122) TaxID=471853 RepID=C5C4C0_BEUC1|nr:ABC transporter ATP-binding protein [Beutenbergia cavernae]ACQ82044.1 ABC transporter related [Beutenbergia cavernae DSM 12333]